MREWRVEMREGREKREVAREEGQIERGEKRGRQREEGEGKEGQGETEREKEGDASIFLFSTLLYSFFLSI